MKISVVFEFNSTNSSSADTNLDTSRFYQKFYKVARYLASYLGGRCKRNREGKHLDGSGENEKRKKKVRKKKEEIQNYADRRWMLQKSLKLWDCYCK